MTNSLENIHHEDLDDLLNKVEKSFHIKFVEGELPNGITFGELCDHISNKVSGKNSDDCTTQQAFYKLSTAISGVLAADKADLKPSIPLVVLFPRNKRRLNVKKVEHQLGFPLDILRPPTWLTSILITIFFGSLISFIVGSSFAIPGIAFSLMGLWLANKWANELSLKTLGDLARQLTRTNYRQSRRNPGTINKKEMELLLTAWFKDELLLKEDELSRKSRICI